MSDTGSSGGPRGLHLLAEYAGVEPALLDDVARLERLLARAAAEAGATILDRRFHRFEGGGVSGMLLLAESHLSIHTWPALGRAAVDVYTCGACDPERAHREILAGLAAREHEVVTIARGDRIEVLPRAR